MMHMLNHNLNLYLVFHLMIIGFPFFIMAAHAVGAAVGNALQAGRSLASSDAANESMVTAELVPAT